MIFPLRGIVFGSDFWVIETILLALSGTWYPNPEIYATFGAWGSGGKKSSFYGIIGFFEMLINSSIFVWIKGALKGEGGFISTSKFSTGFVSTSVNAVLGSSYFEFSFGGSISRGTDDDAEWLSSDFRSSSCLGRNFIGLSFAGYVTGKVENATGFLLDSSEDSRESWECSDEFCCSSSKSSSVISSSSTDTGSAIYCSAGYSCSIIISSC